MVSRFVHEPEDITAANRVMAVEQRKHMDWAGIALLSVGLGALQFLLEEGNRDDWFQSHTIQACAVISVFSLVAFVIRELTAKMPVVDLWLFRDKVFLSGTLISGVMFAILFSVTFLLPLFMQTLLGFSALESGLTLMPRTLVMMVVTPFIGRMYNKVSPRVVVGIGVMLFAVGAYQMSQFTLETSTWDVVASLIVQGLGFSCLFVPLTTVSLSTIERHKLTDATGLNSLFRQVGGSIGLAVFATMLTRHAVTAKASIAANITPTNPIVIARMDGLQAFLMSQGYDATSAKTGAMEMLGGMIARQAMLLSFEKMFLMAGMLFLGVLPLLFLLKTDRSAAPGKGTVLVHEG